MKAISMSLVLKDGRGHIWVGAAGPVTFVPADAAPGDAQMASEVVAVSVTFEAGSFRFVPQPRQSERPSLIARLRAWWANYRLTHRLNVELDEDEADAWRARDGG